MAGLEGKVLNRYELKRLVGRGGMADVYEGFDPRFERKIAVKVFKRDDEEMLRRFIREAHLMARLSNEHLVMVYDSGEAQIDGVTWYYIIMPFMEGGTLRARIRRAPLTLQEACRALKDIATALDYIHSQGIVHRDIKSSNVLLGADGTCYLSDFGIARMTTDMTKLTSTGNVLGTVDYVAPELFEVNRKADARSDLYSLGILLFEMVTGQLPFTADNQIALVSMHVNKKPPSPRSISQQIPAQVDRVILKALEKKPEQRYASATALADTFCNAVAATTKNGPKKAQTTDNVNPLLTGNPLAQSSPPVDAAVGPQQQIRLSPLAGSIETPPHVPPMDSLVPLPVSPLPPQTPVEQKAPSPPPSRRRGIWIAASVALTLLLVASGLLVYLNTRSNTNIGTTGTPTHQTQNTATGATTSPTTPPDLTATAQAAANATNTAVAQATGTAIANEAATEIAQATATAGVIATATSGSPTYSDPLNDSKNSATTGAGWDGTGIFGDPQCVFQADGYHVLQNSVPDQHACFETNNSYDNATISVDITLLNGDSGGLFFRASKTSLGSYHGYLFEIDSTGRYKISLFGTGPLQDWKSSSALKQGYKVKNTLQMIMHGNTFSFYANNVFLVTLTDKDSTYSSGTLALSAFSPSNPTEIVYTNLKVYPAP